MSIVVRAFALIAAVVAIGMECARAQDKPYKEGSVWSLTFIKLKPGMFDAYMRDAVVGRHKEMEEAKKQGLVLSYKVLSGTSANRDDWDLLFMEEFKNWAAFDGLSAKLEAIEAKFMGSEQQRAQAKFKRSDMREVIGEKVMQELLIQPGPGGR